MDCSDSGLSAYIAAQARRHFSIEQDQEDARQLAWESLSRHGRNGHDRLIVYRAIHAFYERERRRRKHEACTQSRPGVHG